MSSSLATLNSSLSSLNSSARKIVKGEPIICFDNTLNDGEIWLEGANVSRTTYATLFAVYGTTYGAGDGSTTFTLPDFRNRALWGSSDYGYISAGLPALYNMCTGIQWVTTAGGVVSGGYAGTVATYGTIVQGLYGANSTVQPPAIKIRVKTKY